MARRIKRPSNYCGDCGYSWHPRGHYTSMKCPGCGSSDVKHPNFFGCAEVVGMIITLGMLLALLSVFFGK